MCLSVGVMLMPESIILGGAERIRGFSFKTCNEYDIGLETPKSVGLKLKWWYKLAIMPEDRYVCTLTAIQS